MLLRKLGIDLLERGLPAKNDSTVFLIHSGN